MFHLLFNLSKYISSIFWDSSDESSSSISHENKNLETQRKGYIFFESVQCLRRLNIILNTLDMVKNEGNEGNFIKFKKEIGVNKFEDINAEWSYSSKHTLYLFKKDIKKQNNDNKSFDFIPEFNENSPDIQHLCELNKKTDLIMLNTKYTFETKFEKLKKMIINELSGEEWSNIKFCKIFRYQNLIKDIICEHCLCNDCLIKGSCKDQQKNTIVEKGDKGDSRFQKLYPEWGFLRYDKDINFIRYFVYFFRESENSLYLTDEIRNKLSNDPKYNTKDFTKIAKIVHNSYTPTKFVRENLNGGIYKEISDTVTDILSCYTGLWSDINVDLMRFMKSPFGFWKPVKIPQTEKKEDNQYDYFGSEESGIKNHEFLNNSYEIMVRNNCFNWFNIYRKKYNNRYKYIAAERCSIIKKGLIWGNGVIIGYGATIDENVTVGKYSFIRPLVKISKNVKIGKRCTIFSSTKIGENKVVEKNTTVPDCSII